MDTPDQLISTLVSKLQELQAQATEQEERLVTLRSDIDAYQRVIASLSGQEAIPNLHSREAVVIASQTHALRQPPSSPPRSRRPTPAKKGSGETQVEWLMRYAREHGGVVAVREAKPHFIASGLTRSKPRNISSHIYGALSRSSQFEKSGEGQFRLIGFQPEPEPEPEPELEQTEEPERATLWSTGWDPVNTA